METNSKYHHDLLTLCNQYINEMTEFRKISVRQAANLYMELVENSDPLVPTGFVKFLKANGVTDPSTCHFSSAWIGTYFEYLVAYHGILKADEAMANLRRFWRWCRANNYIRESVMPADLCRLPRPEKLYNIHISVTSLRPIAG
jgi:hypothetical protein